MRNGEQRIMHDERPYKKSWENDYYDNKNAMNKTPRRGGGGECLVYGTE